MRTGLAAPAPVFRELAWFAVVGLAGFGVDAALFVLLNGTFGWSIAQSRTASASCSITITWILNRRLTFNARRSRVWTAEFARYIAGQLVGLVINLGVFGLALWLVPLLRQTPVAALVLGAGAALLFNFLSARFLVFRPDAR